jgi:chorismate synthase
VLENSVSEIEVALGEDQFISYNDEVFKIFEDINVRCPHIETAILMIDKIKQIKSENDSIGGTVCCVIRNVPQSLGEPCFDKIEADLAKAMLSIPATKGFEIGSGFEGTKLKGSQHNDVFEKDTINEIIKDLSLYKLDLKSKTNFAGGTLGGITTGEIIYFRIAIKPVSTIGKEQLTVDYDNNEQTLTAKGRHDPCVLPRAMPIVEAMSAIVLMDHYLIQATRKNLDFN